MEGPVSPASHTLCRALSGLLNSCQSLLTSPALRDATHQFVKQAAEFDRRIDLDDLYQALRNVWIMNSVQLLLDQEIAFSPSIFAYSMLYPYTDNVLDDQRLSHRRKKAFGRWLTGRLRGQGVPQLSRHRRAVSRLIGMIEGEFPRSHYHDVFESLLAIDRGQQKSLKQQVTDSINDSELLRISIEKGGTSVLAHGYLVKGELEPNEAELLFGYGICLQLLDDVQDIQNDRKAGHHTLFSQHTGYELEARVRRLFHFLKRTLAHDRFSAPRRSALRELVARNCRLLLLSSVARNHTRFSVAFTRELEQSSPFSFHFLRTRSPLIRSKCAAIKCSLADRAGVHSLVEVLA